MEQNTVHTVRKTYIWTVFDMKKRKLGILFTAALAAGMLSTLAALQMQQQALSEKLIRLHVVANSDSEEDQALKLQVRDAVLGVTEPLLETAEDPELAILQALPAIEEAADTCLDGQYPVTVSFGNEEFPTRVYDSFSLPAGVYRSLRVTIGAGEGHNWWCVVFPSICFRATTADLEEAAAAAGFTEAEVQLITEADGGYELKFKSLELLQKIKDWLFS